MENLRSFFEEGDITLLLETLDREEKRQLKLYNAPIRGYGSIDSKILKEAHRDKAEELSKLQSKICSGWD